MEATLLRQVEEVARESNWDLVALFGSQARGQATSGSDIDLAVLRGEGVATDLGQRLGRGDLDVVWLDESSWLMWSEVARGGKLIFSRSAADYEDFLGVALLQSWDSDIWRHRNRRFVERSVKEDWSLNTDLVMRKCSLLARYLRELEPLMQIPREKFLDDPILYHAAERLIELFVECAASINTEVSQSVAGIHRLTITAPSIRWRQRDGLRGKHWRPWQTGENSAIRWFIATKRYRWPTFTPNW